MLITSSFFSIVAHELFEELVKKDFENEEEKNKVCALAKKYGITLKDS